MLGRVSHSLVLPWSLQESASVSRGLLKAIPEFLMKSLWLNDISHVAGKTSPGTVSIRDVSSNAKDLIALLRI